MSSITQTQKEGSDNSEAQELLAKESTMASNRGSKVYRQNDFAKMDNAELIKMVSGLQARLTKIEDMNVDLRAELMKALDQRDLLHKKLNDESINDNGLKQVQDQMLHKDRRILELNNVILEKERKIIDLQEMCSEQGQVAHSKSLAMHIVNNRLRELDAKQMMDATTETDFKFSGETAAATTTRSRSPRRISPGRAIPQFKFGGNGSPPPVDPAEDCSSYTTETLNIDGELGKSKKYRKKVTFDVDGSEARATAFDKQMVGTSASRPIRREPVATANVDYEELLTENDHLRQIISEMEKNQRVENSKSASSQVLKAKAVAQTKIKELEGIIVQNKLATDEEIAELRSVIKQLNDSRDWVLDENAKLQEQLETAKIRCNDLYEELDASLKTTDVFRKRVDESAMKIDAIVSELYQSRAMVQQVSDEKAILASEIERLKEAIFAQDEFITLLEGDLIVYEAHVGILRDSLGASKKEDRQSIKSKAFTAKINALETEKQEIVKKNNEEKLRAKALAIKVRCLEEERDQLKMALRHYEKEFGTATKEAHGQQIVYDNNSQREQQTIERAERQMPSATMTKLSMESVVPDNFMEEKIREANLQNEALQAEKAELQEKLAQLSNSSMHLAGTVKSFFASISQQIDFGMNELDLDNDDGFEEFSNNFVLAERKFCELNAKMKSMGEREHSLLEQLSTLEQELATSKTNVTKLEEEKQKVELELREVQAECQRGVEKLRQNGQFIASLERRNADLAEEISQQNARLGALEERKTLLEEEKASLQQKLEAEIQNLETKSVDLEQQLRATKEERMALGLALTEEKKRLADLIEILTEIVDRFKGAGNSEVLSGDVLHDFLRQHIQPSNDSKSVGIEQESAPKSPNDEPIPLPIPEESVPPKVPTFSKAVSVQVNLSREEENTRRLADLQTTVDKQQNLIKSLEFQLEASRGEHAELGAQLSDLNQQKCELSAERNALLTQVTDQNEQLTMLQNSQQNFSEIQVQLEDLAQQKDLLEAERDDLLAKLAGHTQMLAGLHEQYRHKIVELSDQLTALHQTIGTFEQQQEQQLKKASSNADSDTQTEPAPGEQAMVNQQTQMSCPEKMHAEIQMDPVEMKSAAVQTEEAEAKAEQLASDELLALISNRNEEEAERESAAEVAMVRQQSRQLLMDCIQDREQFERHLGDNVQQLVELKSELESSVDVLRGEIWSLNQELKKRFDERNSLATRLEQMDLLLAESGERSAQLVNAIGEKDAELAQLRRDLDGAAEDKLKMEAQIMELHSLGEEKTRKAESLEKLAVALNSLMRENVREWRNELEQLKALQVECCGQLLERTLQSISTSTDQIARCTAARLTTKTQDNERLLRENTELIQINVRLAKELEEAAADGERKTKSGHQPRLDLDAQMEMAAEAETRVEMQIMKKECGREEANILVAIDQKESLEADIGVEDAGKPVTQSSNNNFGGTRESWDEEGNARRMEEQQQRDRMEEETNDIEKIEDDLGESALNPSTKDENDEPEKEEQFVSKEDGMATENLNLGKEEVEERAEEMQNEPTTEAEEPNEEEATDQEKEEANADDWNWDDDQEAEEEKAEIGNDHGDEGTDMKQKTDNEGKKGKATVAAAVAEQQQQPTDEWAWGEEDEEAAGEDEDDQPVPASKQKDPQASKASAQTPITSATSQQKQKPDVKQLFENW